MIKTVIFDMDGLLINSEPLWQQAMASVFKELGSQLKKEDYAKTTGLRTSEVVEFWCQYFGWDDKPQEQIANDILDEVIRLIQMEGTIMPGVDYILQFFSHKECKLGLASSSPMRLIKSALEHFNLYSCFDAVHSGEHQDFGKPHPSVYIECAKELNSSPLNCLVFEDSITGLIAAKAAQMKAVAVPEKRNWEDSRYALADLKLRSLKEFTEEELEMLQDGLA